MAQPKLTVKSLADYLLNSKSNAKAILHDQKYPTADPQKFKTPYYQGASAAIRRYYANQNDPAIFKQWRNKLLSIKNKARRENNVRVLDVFAASTLAKRKLTPTTNTKYVAMIKGVTVTLSADMQAIEAGQTQIIYFHCRSTALDSALADMTLSLAHWTLAQNGVSTLPAQIEIFDLYLGKAFHVTAWQSSATTILTAKAPAITELWAQL